MNVVAAAADQQSSEFSKWEGIFKDPLTTAAAIDRLVHHSIIVELTSPASGWSRPKITTSRLSANNRIQRPTPVIRLPAPGEVSSLQPDHLGRSAIDVVVPVADGGSCLPRS